MNMKSSNNTNPRLIFEEVLKNIHPDKNYEIEIFNKLSSIIRKINQNQKKINAILGGSGAKGTWLKTFDADIFVLFDYTKFSDNSDKLSDILEKILKKRFDDIKRIHGSRDYFQIRQGNFTFEIVPILKIQKSEQAKNITDVSPLHSKWVKKHKKLISEIRLTKQFCQAQNVYGAESYIKGFSGYTCEILTAYYGSFLNLIKNAAKWRDKTVIDIEKHHKGRDIFKIINTSKLASPLIVIDPVQKDRNAAAALGAEKFELFKKAAKEFLQRPSIDFFTKKNPKELLFAEKSKNRKLISVKAKPFVGKADVVGGKLLKIYEFLIGELNKHGFRILRSSWEWDKNNDAEFYFLFDKGALPKNTEIAGPPLKINYHVENFKKLHKKTFVKNSRIFAFERRKYSLPEKLLSDTLKKAFIRERCKSIKIYTS
ncbi:CCA tRNA nucleotidyltransferase [Candidatus Woesearchaeota archaeon]|nr:CCA tRNA nucleotidyltransferase [Candidatus Woesearchaeota archaeon]